MYDPDEHLRKLDAIIADLTRLEHQAKWAVIGLLAFALSGVLYLVWHWH